MSTPARQTRELQDFDADGLTALPTLDPTHVTHGVVQLRAMAELDRR